MHRLNALPYFPPKGAGASKSPGNSNRVVIRESEKEKNLCLQQGETENVSVCGLSSSEKEKSNASEILMSLSETVSSGISDAPEKMKAKKTTNSSFNFDSILENMANSWRELGLGVTTGSVALNEYLQRVKKTSQNSNLSAKETLYLISTLRAKTWYPPRNSPLNRGIPMQPTCSEMSSSTVSETTEEPTWMQTLSKLYVAMVAQDADDGTLYRNNLLNNYTAFEIASLLRTYENRITDLAIREDSIRLRAQRELNLIPCVTIPHYVEYIHHPMKVEDDNDACL